MPPACFRRRPFTTFATFAAIRMNRPHSKTPFKSKPGLTGSTMTNRGERWKHRFPVSWTYVRHTETTLWMKICSCSENYRMPPCVCFEGAQMVVPELDPTEVITGYYRLPRPMAADLKFKLPKLLVLLRQRGERPDSSPTPWEQLTRSRSTRKSEL